MACRFLSPALLALASGAAGAQALAAPDLSWGVSAGVQHRRLVERADDGRRLVEESGPMLRLALDGALKLQGGGALQAGAGLAGGTLDYEGRTQAGAPLATDSRHRDLALSFGWRPWAPASWGEAWLVLRAVQQRRDIASTATVTGLRETSTLVMPGVRWTGSFDAARWRLRPAAELRTSAWHRLHVDYRGLYDAQDLDGGHRNELSLVLDASTAASPWSWSFEWTRARQAASERAPLTRGGAAAGTVRQPRIEIDDVMLRVRRAF
ncbi:hypothetical protein H8N03_08265 [Ramlibacter sp. USB13]|uniref:DUF481 domain-containing protein n=1 Tax=Ramlibacter cellulosilyticus TaxID=2764187 RepID=A0A923SEH4_9BURK|nr:hypothetical protein [Ramlibacter cellulosilyticus]MBC5782937.1 hypothetical protein [Ramlibacter cellulosilyticus]